MRDKQIQISEKLFTQMCAYILVPEYNTDEKFETIKRAIFEKIDRMTEHELYTKYKTSPTDEQKEAARQEYLDKKGIHPDFRW